jgi:protein-S-isoprenylcysteine O-methyltransferase Ste14
MNLSLLLLFVPVPGLRSRFLPAAPLWTPLGLAVQCAFFALAVWARRHLGRNWSGAISIKVDHQLITSGPYRLVRHPIYTAMLGMFAGTAIVSGQWHALLAAALMTVAYWRKIRLEEQPLHDTFGDAWVAYRARTRALIPWLLYPKSRTPNPELREKAACYIGIPSTFHENSRVPGKGHSGPIQRPCAKRRGGVHRR